MKNFIFIIPLLFICCQEKQVLNKKKLTSIEYSEIEKAEIIQKLYDTISVELNHAQIRKTTEIINSSKSAELMKAGPKYWLVIQFKNDSVFKYKITDSKIGENDLYAELDEKDFFKNIYEKNVKKRNIIDK